MKELKLNTQEVQTTSVYDVDVGLNIKSLRDIYHSGALIVDIGFSER
jgi:hypothetical protein